MRVLVQTFSFAALLILAGCGMDKQTAGPELVPVKAETVATQELHPAWTYSGEIRPDTQVQLAFKEPGYIAALHQIRGADGRLRNVQVGDEIPAGTVTGRITEIAASANRQSRVFNIEVTLPNRDRSLKVGMIASVRIEQADAQTVPVVPLTSLITAESGSNNYSVFTIKERDGKHFAQLKSVRTGETIDKSVVINEGLQPGGQIIVNRTYQLSEGSPIRVVE
jgi:multidrug efflux pump subunit AcrA (membrane-fusion protein)